MSEPVSKQHDAPPRFAPRLRFAPKIRQLYWCDFPQDAHLPEFWKRRPILVMSYRNVLSGAVTAIPCSSQDQSGNRWAVELSTTIDGGRSWAICDKPCSVAVSRLTPGNKGIARLPEDEFDSVVQRLLAWLPQPQQRHKNQREPFGSPGA